MQVNPVIESLQREVVRNGRLRGEALKQIKEMKKVSLNNVSGIALIGHSFTAENCKQTILNVGKNIKALKAGVQSQEKIVDNYC